MMTGDVVSVNRLAHVFGLAPSRIEKWVAEGMPVVSGEDADGTGERDTTSPRACSKRDVARWTGWTLEQISKMVREGLPCEQTGAPRSPLVFDMHQVFRWHLIRRSYEHSEKAGQLMEAETEIWRLEYELACERREL